MPHWISLDSWGIRREWYLDPTRVAVLAFTAVGENAIVVTERPHREINAAFQVPCEVLFSASNINMKWIVSTCLCTVGARNIRKGRNSVIATRPIHAHARKRMPFGSSPSLCLADSIVILCTVIDIVLFEFIIWLFPLLETPLSPFFSSGLTVYALWHGPRMKRN